MQKWVLLVCLIVIGCGATSVIPTNYDLISPNYIESSSGKYRLTMQDNGVLVATNVVNQQLFWNSTSPPGAIDSYAARMSEDCNFFISKYSGGSQWSAGTRNQGEGCRLVIQDNRNIVIYDDANRQVWNTRTSISLNDRLAEKDVLDSGAGWDTLISLNGKYKLIMQGDGNLVAYVVDTNQPFWASDTNRDGNVNYRAVMQSDCNFVIYAGGSSDAESSIWSTDNGGEGCRLVIQDNKKIAIYNEANTVVWSPNTGLPATDRLGARDTLITGGRDTIISPNGKYKLHLQADGNLVASVQETNSTGVVGV